MEKYYVEMAKEIKLRNGACFGISCRDCPLHEEPYIKNFGYKCRGGGQGEYRDIMVEIEKFLSNIK